VVVLNAGDEPADLALTLTGIEGRALAPVTWPGWPWPAGEEVMVAGDGRASVRVPARGALILRAR
jgi:hypothetical protein